MNNRDSDSENNRLEKVIKVVLRFLCTNDNDKFSYLVNCCQRELLCVFSGSEIGLLVDGSLIIGLTQVDLVSIGYGNRILSM